MTFNIITFQISIHINTKNVLMSNINSTYTTIKKFEVGFNVFEIRGRLHYTIFN